MATVNFLLQTKTNPSKIYIRFKDGKKIDIQTKTTFLINPIDWSQIKQRPKNLKKEEFKNLDINIQNLKSNLLNHYNNSTDEAINLIWLKNFIEPKSKSTELIVDYFDFYFDERKDEINHTTIKKLKVIQNKIKRFELYFKNKILFKDINISFKNNFQKYCKEQGYSDNTTANNLKQIKIICNHAKRRGIVLSSEFDEIKTTETKSLSIFLSFNELEVIEKTEFKSENLNNAKEWLIISSFTGQRVSDFMRFTKEMIREQNGKSLIEFTQKKTNKIMTLPLHKEVIKILEKRAGDFPRKISSQKYNKYIKIVCEKANIKEVVYGGKFDAKTKRKIIGHYPKHELVTSHIGRRSFATNFYGKIPTSLLISATGHSTEQMFLVYIGKSSSDKAMQLSEYF